MKAVEQYFHVVLLITLYKVVLTFKSVDETLVADYVRWFKFLILLLIHKPQNKTNLRFLVIHIFVQCNDDNNGQQRSPPVDKEHDHNTHQSPYQGHPHVIVLK